MLFKYHNEIGQLVTDSIVSNLGELIKSGVGQYPELFQDTVKMNVTGVGLGSLSDIHPVVKTIAMTGTAVIAAYGLYSWFTK